jgi:hypothetical protein
MGYVKKILNTTIDNISPLSPLKGGPIGRERIKKHYN